MSNENFVSPSESLTIKEGVITLMKSSKSKSEWNANCDKVKQANNGYPDFWYGAIVSSGLATETSAKWGGDADIHTKAL